MKAYVVVEGHSDAKLITSLLPQDIQVQTVVVPAGGRANLASVAHTLLVTKRKPIAVLADADTLDETAVLDLRREMEELIRAISGGIPFKVFMLVPEIESLFFIVAPAVERITGRKLSAENLALSQHKPHQVIRQLGQEKSSVFDQIVNQLTIEELELIRESSPIKELIEFLFDNVLSNRQSQSA